MSQAGDAYDALSKPLRPDRPFVDDWSLVLELLQGGPIEPPTLVLDAVRDCLDGDPSCETYEVEWYAIGDRGEREQPPCRHVPEPGRFRVFGPITGGRIEIEGVSVGCTAHVTGCEHCVQSFSASVPEEDIRSLWRTLRGEFEGDDEIRPWRSALLVEPRLMALGDRIAALLSGSGELRIRWADYRGTVLELRRGHWVDASTQVS